MDRPERFTESAQIASGIDQAMSHSLRAQRRDSDIDGIALGDAPQIDPALFAPAHGTGGEQFEVAEARRFYIVAGRRTLKVSTATRVRQKPGGHQARRDGNVESAIGSVAEIERMLEYAVGFPVDGGLAAHKRGIDPRHIAARVMKAHQSLHSLDGGECRCDAVFHLRLGATGANFDQRAEQRAHACDELLREAGEAT